MDVRTLFGLSVIMSFIAFGIVTKLYIWPPLSVMRPEDALTALVVAHTFRFVGLSFLVPGVVSPSLPSAFASSAAYGDLAAAALAVAATLALCAHAGWAIRLSGSSTCGEQPICFTQFTRARFGFALAPGHWAPHFSFRRLLYHFY